MSAKEYLDKWYEAKRWEFYAHVRPWIAIGAEMAKASGWRMTYAEYGALIDLLDGMNSYERKVLLPVLDDLAVCELTEYCISQCGPELGELSLAKHYGDAVERELAPLLVKRLREASTRADKFKVHRDTLLEGGCDQVEELTAMSARVAFAEKQFTKAGADNERLNRELLTARKQTATWEIQAQDLRDQLVQAKSELAALKPLWVSACGLAGWP